MKKTGKLSMLLAAAMSAALITMPITANAASMTYDMVYDMDNNDVSSMATNRGENNQNSDLADDPLNSSNKVWKTKSDSSGNGNIVADMNFSPDNGKYIQIEFDLLKEGKDNFQTIVYDSKGWTNGIEALNMTSSGNVDCKTSNGSKYEINKWYTVKAAVDFASKRFTVTVSDENGIVASENWGNKLASTITARFYGGKDGAVSYYAMIDNFTIRQLADAPEFIAVKSDKEADSQGRLPYDSTYIEAYLSGSIYGFNSSKIKLLADGAEIETEKVGYNEENKKMIAHEKNLCTCMCRGKEKLSQQI